MNKEQFNKLVEAAEIASGFFRIVPGRQKVPCVKWRQWITEEQDIENFDEFMQGADTLLALTGIDYVVVDCDTWEAGKDISKVLPVTPLITKTGRGMHLWYAVDKGRDAVPIKNSAGGKHVDVRGIGGVVVIPPTIHPNGKPYQWVFPLDTYNTVKTLPDAEMPSADVFDNLPVLTQDHVDIIAEYNGTSISKEKVASKKDEFFKENSHKGEDILNVKFEKDLWKSDGQTLVELLDKQIVNGRNNHLTVLTGALIRAGFGRAAILSRILEWNAKQVNPLDDDELFKVFTSIVTSETRSNPNAFKDIDNHYDPLDDLRVIDRKKLQEEADSTIESAATAEDDVPPFTTTWLSELMVRDIESDDFWWDRCLFTDSLMMIAGEPKLGKSFFAMQMMIAAATGGQFLAKPFMKPMRCMFVQFELSDYDLKARFGDLIKGLSSKDQVLANSNICIMSKVSIDLDDLTSLKKLIATYEAVSPDLVVIDPLVNLLNGDENDNRKMAEMMTIVKAINDHTHVSSCIVIHHANKGSRGKDISNPFDLIRGASALRGFYDTGIVLRDTAGGIMVDIEKRSGMKINPFIIARSSSKGFILSNDLLDHENKIVEEAKLSSDEVISRYKEVLGDQLDGMVKDSINKVEGARRDLVIKAVELLGKCRWIELMVTLRDLLAERDEEYSERFFNDKAKIARAVAAESKTEKTTCSEFGRDYIDFK